MSPTFGDMIGAGNSFRNTGEGRSMPPDSLPKYGSISYLSWRKGMVAFLSPENTPEDAGRDVLDIEIERDDSLVRPPGIVEVEDVTPRNLRWLFQHASVDYATELVAIDAPYLGYKSVGIFTFVNAGITPPGVIGWNAVNILGVLIFSDGSNSSYARLPGAAVVTDISAAIIARTFAAAFGRIFAGAYTDPIDGLQGMGIKWIGTDMDYTDWTGLGSGEELLVSNTLEADKLVALRPIGYDALAILCRSSIWIGFPTQQADRPADFRIRRVGLGCVAEPTACVCPDGVVFLSDQGVMLFNQNELRNISVQINSALLPLDYTQLDRYKIIYDASQDEVKLQTPTGTWVMEFSQEPAFPERWMKRSYALDNLVMFTDQSGNLYWGTVQGTWADQLLTWAEMIENQEDAAPILYGADGSVLGRFDPAEEQYLGVDMDPHWETRNTPITTESGSSITEMVTTMGFEIEYSCTGVCEITIDTPDEDGDFTQSTVQTLASTVGKRRRAVIWNTTTGQGLKCCIRITSGRPHIYSVKQITLDSGPAVESAS